MSSTKRTAVKKSATAPRKGATPAAKALVKQYSALEFHQRGDDGPPCVLFSAPVGEITKWAEVDTLGPSSQGAQRERKGARVDAIKKFLEAGKSNIIPTALIVAFSPGSASFSVASEGAGTLKIKSGAKKAGAVVDGQHRLYGIEKFDPKVPVAIVGILEADDVERAFQFLVINNKASKVPATHTKALLAKMSKTSLPMRLKTAKLAFDAEGIRDIDLVNLDKDSPFYQTIDWTTTPAGKRMVPATSIELALDYLGGLGIAEFEDRDTRRSVFLTVWKAIKSEWGSLWVDKSRLVSKVGIVCLTRFILDLITSWADNDDLEIDLTDLDDIKHQTLKILNHMDKRFWTTAWSEKAPGGFDTTQGRDRVLAALVQLHRNGRKDIPWYTDIDIIDRAGAKS